MDLRSHLKHPHVLLQSAVNGMCACAGRDEQGDEYVRLRCALMRLSLPVELLAAQLLRLPLQEVAQEV